MRVAALLLPAVLTLSIAVPRAAADSAAPLVAAVPVDQAVADLDPLARSLRLVQPGLRQDGEQTSLFAVPLTAYSAAIDAPLEIYQPTNALIDGQRYRYYRVGPGFRARVQRVDYLVRRGRKGLVHNQAPHRDGYFMEGPGIAAVYELEPLSPLHDNAHPAPAQTSIEPPPAAAIPGRLDNRIETRLESRLGPPGR